MRKLSNYTVSIPLKESEYALFSFLTGSMDIVDEDTIKGLMNSNAPLTPKMVEYFASRGYLAVNNQEKMRLRELHTLRDKERKKAPRRSRFAIMLTYNCNLKCSYCYESHVKKFGKNWLEKTLTTKEVDKIFEAITKLDVKKQKAPITLYGGEPLLPQNQEILGYILTKGEKNGYRFILFTNGVYLKDFAESLAHFNNVDIVIVTFYGLKETHNSVRTKADGSGSFDDIVQGVDAVKDADLKISIKINLDERVLPELPEFCQFIRSKGWVGKNFIISPTLLCDPHTGDRPPTYAENLLRHLCHLAETDKMVEYIYLRFINDYFEASCNGKIPSPRLWACPGLINDFYVFDPHGDVYSPCCMVVGEPEFKCGRYLPSLVIDEKKEILRKRDVFSIPECQKCKYAFLCGGGCVYSAYKSTGSFFKPSCSLFKASMKYVTPFFLKKRFGGTEDQFGRVTSATPI